MCFFFDLMQWTDGLLKTYYNSDSKNWWLHIQWKYVDVETCYNKKNDCYGWCYILKTDGFLNDVDVWDVFGCHHHGHGLPGARVKRSLRNPRNQVRSRGTDDDWVLQGLKWPGKQTVCELEHGPVEIVDFPSSKSMVMIFQFAMSTFTRGYMIITWLKDMTAWFGTWMLFSPKSWDDDPIWLSYIYIYIYFSGGLKKRNHQLDEQITWTYVNSMDPLVSFVTNSYWKWPSRNSEFSH